MAKSKTPKPKTPKKKAVAAAAPKPAIEFGPSVFSLDAGGEVLKIELPKENAWKAVEAAVKPFLAGREAGSLSMTYKSAALHGPNGHVSYSFTRASGQPYSPAEMLSYIKDFAHREMLELYGKTALKPVKKPGKGKAAADSEDESFDPTP